MFYNRKDAALQLATALEEYRGINAVVLGIPRGGAVTAYFVARHLQAEFSLLVSKKLGHPANPEYAVGAVAEDGTVHINAGAGFDVTKAQIDGAVDRHKKEIERRIAKLRKGEPLPELKNRTVLIIDDGIATGATILAAVGMCKKKGASRIVVAAPVSGIEMKKELEKVADDVVILEIPDRYHAVSQVYESFQTVTNEEALKLLEDWKLEQKP